MDFPPFMIVYHKQLKSPIPPEPRQKNYSGMSFWARGYFVSTVGADEEVVRAYIREQEQEDHRVEQLQLFR